MHSYNPWANHGQWRHDSALRRQGGGQPHVRGRHEGNRKLRQPPACCSMPVPAGDVLPRCWRQASAMRRSTGGREVFDLDQDRHARSDRRPMLIGSVVKAERQPATGEPFTSCRAKNRQLRQTACPAPCRRSGPSSRLGSAHAPHRRVRLWRICPHRYRGSHHRCDHHRSMRQAAGWHRSDRKP